MIVLLLLATVAQAEDYWSNCEQAYEFCTRRPYHRDCAIWTHYRKPLLITKWPSQFCKDNPWHMACGSVEECPIPRGSK